MAEELENQEPVEDAQSESIELTVNDLNALKQIIDVASSRGAFKPNEMTVIGNTYTKLETFLNAVAQQQSPQGAPNA
tara:strand:- start:509 stop:739 length:231 start_codon:yes stop_codon:yes gene_type:complete